MNSTCNKVYVMEKTPAGFNFADFLFATDWSGHTTVYAVSAVTITDPINPLYGFTYRVNINDATARNPDGCVIMIKPDGTEVEFAAEAYHIKPSSFDEQDPGTPLPLSDTCAMSFNYTTGIGTWSVLPSKPSSGATRCISPCSVPAPSRRCGW